MPSKSSDTSQHKRQPSVKRRTTSRRVVRSKSTKASGAVNLNGQLIIQALQDLNRPASMVEVVRQLAIRTNSRQQSIWRTVKGTLTEAIRFGFVQQVRGKYCILPTNVPNAENVAGGLTLAKSTDRSKRKNRDGCDSLRRHLVRRAASCPLQIKRTRSSFKHGTQKKRKMNNE
ncbi:uncharacterized protein LOC115631540 isoform X1 [Scaptodrosophila lebanonensis]|uniref:Uncharacterized protein LOC115631540 isoform X1 n=1 Tax=Drosophila lebanonensis TaxID=7225 RepID=A0A6J2U762_DROLE|nr:uncharacterized protein LOC115631540 isoform X1 [Scaptodrosophila lebanonensis]